LVYKCKEERRDSMLISKDESKPLYTRIAEGIEDEILKGNIAEQEQVPSTNQFAVMLQINPATAAKGINLLVSEEVLYKKRGIGMFVSEGAKGYIIKKRKKQFFQQYLLKAIEEGEKLNISGEEIISMIKEYGEERK
jgi:DNA-binding transcriptional regulator YhcF (GntR family)